MHTAMKRKTGIYAGWVLVLLFSGSLQAQSLHLDKELQQLIHLSVEKDHRVAEKAIDKKITEEQQKALRSAYLPTLEAGGKYVYAYTSIDGKLDEFQGFESLQQLQQMMQNPAFPVLFPNLAQLSNELTQLQQLLVQQGVELPAFTRELSGNLQTHYAGVDATAKVLLYSGGQVPNLVRAMEAKARSVDALSEKCISEVISEVISCYDQLALLKQSGNVIEESSARLAAERKYAGSALRNGMGTSFDTLKIAVAEASLYARRAELESRRMLLFQKLSQLTGKPAQDFSSLTPSLELLLFDEASGSIENRAELKALEAGLEARKYMLRSEKLHYMPKVQAMASLRYDNMFKLDAELSAPTGMRLKSDCLALGPTAIAGIGFKWDIYSRSGGTSKVKVADLEVERAGNAVNEARELLQLHLVKSVENYKAAMAQVTLKERQRHAAYRALELARTSYNEGMISITERLAAETDVQNAELEYLSALFNQRQSALECYKASGHLHLSSIQ